MKKCPFCAEEIQDEAIKCRYCGEWIKPIEEEHRTTFERETPLEKIHTKRSWWKSPYVIASSFGLVLASLANIGHMSTSPELSSGIVSDLFLRDLILRSIFNFLIYSIIFLFYRWLWIKSKLAFWVLLAMILFGFSLIVLDESEINLSEIIGAPPIPTINIPFTATPEEYLWYRAQTFGCALEEQSVFVKPYDEIVGYASPGECWVLKRKTRSEEWVEIDNGWLDRDKVQILTKQQANATVVARVTATAAAKP